MTAEGELGPVDFAHPANFDAIFDSDVDGLLDAPQKAKRVSASDRLERAFLEIVEFRRTHGRSPDPQTREIAERKLGARLDGILASEDKLSALRPLDVEFGLLDAPAAPESLDDLLADDELNLLGDESGLLDVSDLPTRATRVAPEDVAQRVKSVDFAEFEQLFLQKHEELKTGVSKLVPFADAGGQQAIDEGRFFVLGGIMLFVAEITEPLAAPGIRTRHKPRTRTIFENGTESSLYRRSLAGQLLEKEGYAVVPADVPEILEDDTATGYVYVLRSLSDDPNISGMRDLHKIGFTRGTVEKRIANAAKSPTYLMAPVELVASYRTYNLKTSALEDLLHRVFAEVRLEISQIDRWGRSYDASEWFVVPRGVIDQAIELIVTGEIVDYIYDAKATRLVRVGS